MSEDFKPMDAPVRPLPCVRDENGDVDKQSVKKLFAKVNEELDEFKAVVLREATLRNDLNDRADGVDDDSDTDILDEWADLLTAATTLVNALGFCEADRDAAIQRTNEKNMRRGRL